MMRLLLHIGVFVLLTILTQIGGIAYLGALWISRGFWRRSLLFLGLYTLVTISTIFIAPIFGRQALPCFQEDGLAPRSLTYCAMNRQYVAPELHRLTGNLARYVLAKHPDTVTLYLDAGFPFGNGFPLLPHLSHDDGRKLDLAFYYGADEYLPGETPSPLGYWGFQEPDAKLPKICNEDNFLTLRWDMNWFQSFVRDDLTLDSARTATMLRWLAEEGAKGGVEKILLEPHLRTRFSLPASMVRFQGCRAARHDDHVHLQIK